MSGSLRTDPRPIRAARRARFPVVRVRRPGHRRHHPAPPADVRAALRAFGEEFYYGVRSVELRPAPAPGVGAVAGVGADSRLVFGSLVGPGEIVLYDQPLPPWRFPHPPAPWLLAEFAAAGADVRDDGVVSWPGDTLRHFMLGHVLAHELGHHVVQHERRLRGERGVRTREHEARADLIAARLRRLLD
ncbi:hypothetical protein J5X84_01790 [Streptosporangiaceae bacterium NEAU-GS5]|nr:hypothetical protein [Streptosporangiaceae bacterium NEAU-GS5]